MLVMIDSMLGQPGAVPVGFLTKLVFYHLATMPEKLGTSKVTAGNRIVLVRDVATTLGVTQGDVVAFYEDVDGRICIRKLE